MSLLLGILLSAGCQTRQETFATPDDAVTALVTSLRPELDRHRLEEVLGPDAVSALPSGDRVADRRAIETFLVRFDRSHRLVTGPEGVVTLEIDHDHWPFPFPLIESDGRWSFDSDAGIMEIDNRRIGMNELDTIQTMLAIVDAQREYAWMDVDGDGLHEYAAKFRSDEGTRDGLSWPAGPDEAQSPLGDLIARAAAEGYQPGSDVYHGYRFRMLTAQGPGAAGGAADYLVRGRLLGGFAVVAWPAKHGRSGIQTFIVNQDGVVFERDLGEGTEGIALAMTAFDPGGWILVEGP
jgi:hypothetical protein